MEQKNSHDKLLGIVAELVTELHPEAAAHREITLDSVIDRDLGLDSLARIELLARVEKRFGVRLPEKTFSSVETPRDVLRALGQSKGSTGRVQEEYSGPVSGDEERYEVNVSHAQTLTDVLQQHARTQPEAAHITLLQGDEERVISYGELYQEALRAAAVLRQLELESGTAVALMLPTGVDYFSCFFGILFAGCVPVPLYPPARPTQLEEHVRRHRKILSNSGAPLLVTIEEAKPVARLLMSQVPELQKLITARELFSDARVQDPLLQRGQDTAFMQYTSGSTGDPKGVILSHANLLANIRAMGQVCQVSTEDVFVSWLPLYHDMGLIGAWLGSLYYGCRLVVMPPLSFIARPERWLWTIHKFGGTLSASPNFGYELCCSRLDDSDLAGLDLRSWRMAFNGAEPVIPDTLRRFIKRFQPYGFKPESMAPVYGLAESSVGLAFPKPGAGVVIDRINRNTFIGSGRAAAAGDDEDSPLEFINSGSPLPGHQIRIVDKDGRELPERSEGRLQFKGPSSTTGYFRNSRETGKLFVGEWLDSGDLAYMASGSVYITSRVKDMIIRGGRNIYAHELEEQVNTIDGIRRGCTAVFGSRSRDDSMEKLVVLAETRKQKDEDQRALRKAIDTVTIDLLGMAPDDVILAPPGTVLKTSSGKIRRSACRKLYESGHIGRKKAAVWLQLTRMGLQSVPPLLRRLFNRLASLLYGMYCWLILGLFVPISWAGLMLMPPGKAAWGFASRGSRLLCFLTAIRVSRKGREHIRDNRQYIYISNHMSYLDAIILTGQIPGPCSFVAKAELADNFFLRAGFKKLGVLLVARFDAEQGVEDTGKINDAIRAGECPFFFAEGTLQRMPGLLPFQMGAFVLSVREQLPVVPVILEGTRNILRGGSWIPRPGGVHITFAPPCSPQSQGWQGAIELRDRVRRVVLENLNEPDLAGEYMSLHQMEISKPRGES